MCFSCPGLWDDEVLLEDAKIKSLETALERQKQKARFGKTKMSVWKLEIDLVGRM